MHEQLSAEDLQRIRLQQQKLIDPSSASVEELVGHFGAVQAQDFAGALWAVGQRKTRATEKMVEVALRERRIVRAWPMRGTLHFVLPQDLRWMLELLSNRIIKRMEPYFRKEGLDTGDFVKARKIVERQLRDGVTPDRTTLYQMFSDGGVDTSGQRGLFVVLKLALDRVLCFGARQGKQQTFALLDAWVPSTVRLSADESWTRLATMYFQSHGPATANDFAWWAGCNVSEAKRAMDMIAPMLRKVVFDEQDLHWVPGPVPRRRSKPMVRLLSAYDEFLIGYQDRTSLVGDVSKKSISAESIFWSTVLVDGRIVGTWKRTLSAKGVQIQTKFFQKPSPPVVDAVENEKLRYSKFLGVELLNK